MAGPAEAGVAPLADVPSSSAQHRSRLRAGYGVVVTRVLAEGRAGGSTWRLVAFRTKVIGAGGAARGRRRSELRVLCGAYWEDQGRNLTQWVSVDQQPVSTAFCQHDASNASVLYGAVTEDVDGVGVEPVRPVKRSARDAAIISADGLGRFFAVALEEPVELAGIRPKPTERFDDFFTFAPNMRLERRRQSAESVELGRGFTPAGKRWRLRLWYERADMPELQRVDLTTAEDDEAIDRMHSRLVGGGGYGGPAIPPDQVVACRMWGGTAEGLDEMVEELIPAVARVLIRLDDGSDLEAQLVRTDVVHNDYFVAFKAPGRHPVRVVALDEHDRPLGQTDSEAGLVLTRQRSVIGDAPAPRSAVESWSAMASAGGA